MFLVICKAATLAFSPCRCAHAGYRVSGTHANPLGLKTDAPPEVFWDVMRCWVAEHPTKKSPDPESYAGKLLSKPPQLKANFARARGATSAAKTAKVRWLLPFQASSSVSPLRKAVSCLACYLLELIATSQTIGSVKEGGTGRALATAHSL